MKNIISQLFLGYRHKNFGVYSAWKKQKDQLNSIWEGKDYPDFGIERIVRLICILSNYVFPTLYVRWLAGKYGGWIGRKIAMDILTLLNFILPIIALKYDWQNSLSAVLICAYFSLGTISYIINLIILESEYTQPGSYLRSIICFAFNFVQIIACFALLYRFLGAEAFTGIEDSSFDALHAFYYSFIVSATIGFGDITPTTSWTIMLTICQASISLLFLYVIITKFMAHLGERTYANTPAPKKSSKNTSSKKNTQVRGNNK